MSARPTVLVIGAQKAATTTVYELLRRHPDIHLPAEVKETNFFIDEGSWDRGLDWYEGLYEPGRDHRHRGDISPAYTAFPLFRHAPERAASLVPDARLVYVVREPVERMVSAWTQLSADGHEHRPLADALLHEAHYAQLSSYGLQLDRWLEHFPLEALLVVRSEDLLADPGEVLDQVLAHLSLPPGWRPDALGGRWNTSAGKTTVPRALRTAAALLRTAGADRLAVELGPKGRVGRRLRRPVAPDAGRLDAALAADLRRLFDADLRRLREIVGPGLDLWGIA